MTKKKHKPTVACHVQPAEMLTKVVQPGSVDLILADPPYNIGQKYSDYEDSQKKSDFLAWCERWAAQANEVLSVHGSMFVFMGWRLASEVDLVCKAAGFHKRASLCWHYTFGVNSKKNFTPSHTPILYYTKHPSKFTFNADDPELRHPSARQLKYNDKRANPAGRLPDDVWVLLPEHAPAGSFDPAGDVWLESRICGTFRERKNHSPNQLPEPIVERIVRAASNPGDLVVDPFLGTGTTGVICQRLGRNFVGADISDLCVEQSRERIAAAAE